MTETERLAKEILKNRIEAGEDFTYLEIFDELEKQGGDMFRDQFSLLDYINTLVQLEVVEYDELEDKFIILEL